MKKFLKYFITLLSGFALGIISIALVFGIFISGLTSQIGNSKEEELSESTILNLTLGTEVTERSTSNPLDEIISAASNQSPALGRLPNPSRPRDQWRQRMLLRSLGAQ